MKNSSFLSVYGLGGDALMAPEHTETAFWAALGGGADGFLSGVRLTKDNIVVCSNYDSFEKTCGNPGLVKEMTWEEIKKLDAGFTFRSTVLDAENQPTTVQGKDKPWEANLPKKRAIRILRLSQALIIFARRCSIKLLLSSDDYGLVDHTIAELKKYGVLDRVLLLGEASICAYIQANYPNARYGLVGKNDQKPDESFVKTKKLGAELCYLDFDTACIKTKDGIELDPNLKSLLEKSDSKLLLGSKAMPFAPKTIYLEAIYGVKNVIGIITKGVIPTMEFLQPAALIAEDDFKGNFINQELWTAGYSHINQDTQISQNDGIHIHIADKGKDGVYSGAAAICLIPIHGRFDAQVDFRVENPQQGTTFEMAAICIDPGYYRIDNSGLNTRNVNLTFDVHGAPPYASSERDENDGFRCGWNNGFNLTKVAPDWEAASVNMYNKYGRDVGNGERDNPTGKLRLIRNGAVFTTYYQDKYNEAWVCSGTMLVQNMSSDVYLRLAAKHWNKGGNNAPGNDVWFYNFKLYQF